jgi:hypothetical protein
MPSAAHQSLLLWLLRKMTADGFVVESCDGPAPRGGFWNTLPRSPEVFGVRPDAFAVEPTTGAFAFAEAKTHEDIVNGHTRGQLQALGRAIAEGGERCRLYVAVPRSAAMVLDRVMLEAGLAGGQVVRMHIPDCFLKEQRDEHV